MKAKTASWWQHAVFYQLYPRSFYDSGATGTGDINGIRHKLGYLKALGIDALWLSPVFPSPDKDFGYDIQDYCAIDPRFGTMHDFERLIEAVHAQNMRIILDGVFNHTSDQHPWFQDARAGGPKKDWYIWSDQPNNWTSAFGGSAWTYEPNQGQWYLHSFAKEQPDLNWSNPEVEEAILNVMAFWYARGIDGFRLDVFNSYHKAKGRPDNPRRTDWLGRIGGFFYSYINQEHRYDRDQPSLLQTLRNMRRLADQYDAVLIGETLDERLVYDNAAQYAGTDYLHLVFHFQLLHTRWKPQKLVQSCYALQRCFSESWPTIVLSNHDFPRQSKRWGEHETRRKLMALLALTQRGTPFIYYGEELAMRETTIPRARILDPVGKRFWPFFAGRDACRTPMQWDDSQFAGFSTAPPWLPVNADYTKRNAAALMAQPHSIWQTYQSLLRLRKLHPTLQHGQQAWVSAPPGCLFYRRSDAQHSYLCLLNFSATPHELPVYSGTRIYQTHQTKSNLLRAYEGIMIKES